MSDTPQTDAIVAWDQSHDAHWEDVLAKMLALAEKLERENTQLQRENTQLKEFLSPRSQEIREVILEKIEEAKSKIYSP